jgi:adenylate cyclase
VKKFLYQIIIFLRLNFLFLLFIFFSSTHILVAQDRNIPIDLTKLDWYVKAGFQEKELSYDFFHEDDSDYKKIDKFPIILNSLFKNSISNHLHEYTLKTRFSIDTEQIQRGKEISIYLAGIGEAFDIYLNGKKIANYIIKDSNDNILYQMRRGTIVPIPIEYLKNENCITIDILGYAPSSFLSINTLFGLRFSEGYQIDYDKKLREIATYLDVLLFNSIYIFFGLYHLFFYIKWPQKKYNLYFALFSLALSGYFIAFTPFIHNQVLSTEYILKISYTVQPIALVNFLLFLNDYFYPKNKISYFLIYSIFSNLFIIFLFFLTKINFMQSILFLWYIFAVPQFLYIFVFIFKILKEGVKDSLPIASTIFILLFVIIFEILDTVIFHTGYRLFQYAYFAFIISIVIILANRFIEINQDTINLNIEITKQRDIFLKFVPIQFLEVLGKDIKGGIDLGECKLTDVTILFADIRDFTKISEIMTPDESFKFINSYLGTMGPVIEKNNGFIDKYIGDSIMAIFLKAEDAVNASVEMVSELNIFNEQRKKIDRIEINIGIGIHSGKVMMGTVGHKNRLSTTVIGDIVNVASRLESLTKIYKVKIIMSEDTVAALPNHLIQYTRLLDFAQIRGKSISISIFEIFKHEEVYSIDLKNSYKQTIELAIQTFNLHNSSKALELFKEIKRLNKDDYLVDYFISKISIVQ